MKASKIVNLFDNSLKQTCKHYNNLLEDFKQEEIHDFRLQIKKLRALIRLVNTKIAKEKSININKEIKTFYHTTGRIRNLQLHKEQMAQYVVKLSVDTPVMYMELLDEEEAMEKKKARAEAKDISFSHFKKKIIELVPAQLTAPCIQYFTILKRNELLALLSLTVYEDENLHSIRKIVKDILYNWNHINPYLASVFPAYFVQKENLESLATKLGDFHDLCVAILFFAPFYFDQVIGDVEKINLTTINRRIDWEKFNSKEQIVLLLESLKKDIAAENTVRDLSDQPSAVINQ